MVSDGFYQQSFGVPHYSPALIFLNYRDRIPNHFNTGTSVLPCQELPVLAQEPTDNPQVSAEENPRVEFARLGTSEDKGNVKVKGVIRNLSAQTISIRSVDIVYNDYIFVKKLGYKPATIKGEIIANITLKPGESIDLEDTDAISSKLPLFRVIPVTSWTDGNFTTHSSNFASCMYVANVEPEKKCIYK